MIATVGSELHVYIVLSSSHALPVLFFFFQLKFGSITLTALLPFHVDYQVCPIILAFLVIDNNLH